MNILSEELPDPVVLGKILLLQGAIDASPDSRHLAETIVQGLSSIPGIEHADLRFADGASANTGPSSGNVSIIKTYSLTTINATYGSLRVSLTSPDEFEPYEPFLINTVNWAAIQIENRRLQDNLAILNKNLESEIEARTREIRESELRYRTLFEQASDSVCLLDLEAGTIIDFNTRAFEMLGYTREEYEKLRISDIDVYDNEEEVLERLHTLDKTGEVNFESQHKTKNGEILDVSVSIRTLQVQGLKASLAIVRDISDIKEKESRLALAEFALRNVGDEVFLCNSEAGFDFVNKEACRKLGYTEEEILKLKLSDIDPDFPMDQWDEMWNTLKTQGTNYFETSHMTRDGKIYPVEISANFIEHNGKEYNITIARDLTERIQMEHERLDLERQVQHTQKLESLGILAGGIAHDFNNILVAILGHADLALLDMRNESTARPHILQIERGAQRAAELASQMLAYSGRGRFEIQSLDINQMVKEISHLLKAAIPKHITIAYHLKQEIVPFKGDPAQIQQVFMNLITNASEAIGEKHGTISITTSEVDAESMNLRDMKSRDPLAHGNYVCLEVRDSGCGMDNETQERLFDPFFTTKFTGRGLGMAAVQGIICGHKGAITIDSEPDKGSTFRVYLPATSEANLKPVSEVDVSPSKWVGEGLVLLVDDEEMVAKLGKAMLKRLGFDVIIADNGESAIEIMRTRESEITSVILDLTMPKMDGEQCFHELQKIRDDIPILISSGYAEQEVTERFQGYSIAGFVQKPYKLEHLRDKLHAVMDSAT